MPMRNRVLASNHFWSARISRGHGSFHCIAPCNHSCCLRKHVKWFHSLQIPTLQLTHFHGARCGKMRGDFLGVSHDQRRQIFSACKLVRRQPKSTHDVFFCSAPSGVLHCLLILSFAHAWLIIYDRARCLLWTILMCEKMSSRLIYHFVRCRQRWFTKCCGAVRGWNIGEKYIFSFFSW